MKTKFRGVIASLILGGILMSACAGTTDTESTVSPDEISKNISESETSTPQTDNETGNLFLGCTVFYGCGASISGDRFLNAMTDGDSSTAVTIKPALKDAKGNDKKLTFTDWYGTTHQETLDGSQVDFSVDLGFMSRIDTLKLKFDKYNGKPIRVFASTDGYNFSFFLGEFDTYDSTTGEWTAETGGFSAKAILFVLPIETKEGFERNIMSLLHQRFSAYRADPVFHITAGTARKTFDIVRIKIHIVTFRAQIMGLQGINLCNTGHISNER